MTEQREWAMRRQSGGHLYWHVYKSAESRGKWARIYYSRGDVIWMNESGSTHGLFFLSASRQWNPKP